MKRFFLPNADNPLYQWMGFIAFLLILCVCLGGFLVWLQTSRQGKARRKRKHRHHRPANPTLAQSGGLPPKRAPNQPPPGP